MVCGVSLAQVLKACREIQGSVWSELVNRNCATEFMLQMSSSERCSSLIEVIQNIAMIAIHNEYDELKLYSLRLLGSLHSNILDEQIDFKETDLFSGESYPLLQNEDEFLLSVLNACEELGDDDSKIYETQRNHLIQMIDYHRLSLRSVKEIEYKLDPEKLNKLMSSKKSFNPKRKYGSLCTIASEADIEQGMKELEMFQMGVNYLEALSKLPS